jgi:transcriptional regulator with GAF, ATPase, and Fis domain
MTDPFQALDTLRSATAAFAEAEMDPAQTLRAALDHLIRVTRADAGAVAVPGGDSGQPNLIAERRVGGADPVSTTVLAAALADPETQTTITEPPDSHSVLRAGITSILCMPVRRRGRTLAAVYLDRRGTSPPFDEVARCLAASYASTLALSLDLTARIETVETQREQAEQSAEEVRSWARHVHDFQRFGELTTRSDCLARCLAAAEQVARYNVDLLLHGETGTGKEYLARSVHTASGRPGRFIAVNCTALPESIAENELFGHEPGAFTGAQRQYRGYVEQAAVGTLFLDEIGDLPLAIQPKLLRVLEDKRVRRIGGDQEIPIDVRIIAATNKALDKEVEAGRFREDLYYRLKVVSLTLPPLRERLEDLPDLAGAFLELACREIGRSGLSGWEPEALRRLALHPWPGNVRELKNAIKQLCVLCKGPNLTLSDVEDHLAERFGEPGAGRLPAPAAPPALTSGKTLRERMKEAETELIQAAIRQEGSLAAAARLLGVRRQALHQRCIHLGLDADGSPVQPAS